jgi:3-isopropylmalate/(R)-2-methylmalate dehydratase small subunit
MTQHRVWVYGDNVNTDVIFPGKYTYTLKTNEDIAAHALEDLDPTFKDNVQPGDVIVGGRNWGCGSSREQAVTTLKYAGVNVIVAASFNGLYFRNCINQGVLPVVLPLLHDVVQTGDLIEIDLANAKLTAHGQTFDMPRLSPSVQAIIDTGGLVPMLNRRFAAGG